MEKSSHTNYVFKATTKEGRSVAVKVQYKDLRKRMKSDVSTINILLKIGAFLHPKVDFTWILNDFVDALKQELDFVNEARNGERCAKDLAHLKYVRVPKILWKYTNTRVLVTEFVEGIKINESEALREAGFSLRDVNYKLFESFGCQIFQSGFVHADPHPGNVMVRRNEKGQIELVILDHGLYQQITEEERISLGHLWKAIVLRDHAKMQSYSKSMGVDDHIMFAEILTQAPLRSTGFKLKIKPSEEDEIHMKKFASERFDLIVRCLRQMPRSLLLVVRNLNTIRAISYDLGSPVDRYAVLARVATKAVFEDEHKTTYKIIVLPRKLWFEIKLITTQLANYWRTLFLHIMHKLGLTPNINAIIESATKEANQFI